MIQSEVVNKMAMEMAHRLGDFEHLKTCKFYINMAITIGTEYFTRQMEEIIAMNFEGVELGRFKSETDAANKLGLDSRRISDVFSGRQQSTGGYKFIKVKDRELIKRDLTDKYILPEKEMIPEILKWREI